MSIVEYHQKSIYQCFRLIVFDFTLFPGHLISIRCGFLPKELDLSQIRFWLAMPIISVAPLPYDNFQAVPIVKDFVAGLVSLLSFRYLAGCLPCQGEWNSGVKVPHRHQLHCPRFTNSDVVIGDFSKLVLNHYIKAYVEPSSMSSVEAHLFSSTKSL